MTITEIKANLTIGQVLAHYNLKPDSKNRLACPFHDDKKPSLQVYPDSNTCYCFSTSCNPDRKSMDVIDFIMNMEKCSKHEAIQKAKEMLGGSALAPGDFDLDGQMKVYQKVLGGHEEAQEYCKSRGLDWKALQIGYKGRKTPDRWGRGCIIFGLRSVWGEVVSLYGRGIKGTSHFYQTGRRGSYPCHPSRSVKRLILAESVIDAASLWQLAEVKKEYGVLALFGSGGLTQGHIEAMRVLQELEEVIFFLDGDDAGRKAVASYAEKLKGLFPSLSITNVETPQGRDVNGILVSDGALALTTLIDGRMPVQVKAKQETIQIEPQPKAEVKASGLDTSNVNNIKYVTSTAVYFIKGGIRKDLDSMKVTLVIEHLETKRKSRSKVDLYEDMQVEKLSRKAGEKLGLRSDLIERDLGMLTDLLDQYRERLQQDRAQAQKVEIKKLSRAEEAGYIEFGRKPKLMERINTLIGQSGIVGEEKSRLFLFCAGVSHRMSKPLNVVVQGSSGSGKSHLIKVISHLVPQDKVKRYTRLSEKSFYNFGEYDLCNALIVIEDYDGMSEEVEYALRELQSNGVLISAVSGKEFEHAQVATKDKVVRGPIGSIVATTRGAIYYDNSTRVFFIAIDESMEQTERIIGYKNQKANGEIQEREERKAQLFLQDYVSTLKSYQVKNPYLKHIQLPVRSDQLRRLHELLEGFCTQVTLIHQHQRKRTADGRLIAERSDMEMAIDLMFESIILKVDELDGRLRLFYEDLKEYVQGKSRDYEFTRREVRQYLGISKTQMQRYMRDLEELEYISMRGRGRHGSTSYRVVYWDDNVALRKRIKSNLRDQLKHL